MSHAPIRDPDTLDIALRVYTTRLRAGAEGGDEPPSRKVRRRRQRRMPHRALVFDCETRTDAAQALIFGSWRYFVERHDRMPGYTCVEEGIFYADDLPEADPDTYGALVAYVADHDAEVWPGSPRKIRLLSRSEFVEEVFGRYGYRHRALVVGFNLPFDLTRLAVHVGDARRAYAGGISLQLWRDEDKARFRPRVAYKTIDSIRHLIGFTAMDGGEERFRGHFLDLRTLCFALSDFAGSLESCSERFGVNYTKRAVHHGHVDENYITYCREDVAATAALFRAAMTEYVRHPIALQPTRAFSPAAIGKAYLKAMGIRPVLERQPDVPPEILGYAMAAFFGGRAECRIRRVPLPVIYVDFLSMYPTVNTLMGSWNLLTARRIAVCESAKLLARVRDLVADPQLFERAFTRHLWPELLTLVEIRPDGDLVPVRAAYDPAGHDFGIGLNPYFLDGTAWYTLADVLASVILTGKIPDIVRALCFKAVGQQKQLNPTTLRGLVDINPEHDDFFRHVIEQRALTANNKTLAKQERDRTSQSLKTTANATGYGINAEYVRHEHTADIPVRVYSDRNFDTTTPTPEDPGEYCFPPLAACITGAARLMLALLQRCVHDTGGTYVFCDTDSMAIVANETRGLISCRGGPHHLDDGTDAVLALSRRQTQAIVKRFVALNPYDSAILPGSVLKIEKENYDEHKRWHQLWCWAISAKRYCLYTLDEHGEPTIVKCSEHGLGHVLNPTNPDDPSRDWITQTWIWLLRRELGLSATEPRWVDRIAASRITVSTPTVLHWFDSMNEGRRYEDQIKPANFMLVFHPQPVAPSSAAPIAPYTSDATRWGQDPAIDRHTGAAITVTGERFDGMPRRGVVHVQTYRHVLGAYLAHPETKSLAPDGSPYGRNTRGLLQRRPMRGILPAHYIGKEANRIDDRTHGIVDGPDGYLIEYVDPEDQTWHRFVVPVLRTMKRPDVVEQSGLSRRAIEGLLLHNVQPRKAHREALSRIALDHVAAQLQAPNTPSNAVAAFQRFISRNEDASSPAGR
jgi:hypothetical protein